jgi:hypothetical protein
VLPHQGNRQVCMPQRTARVLLNWRSGKSRSDANAHAPPHRVYLVKKAHCQCGVPLATGHLMKDIGSIESAA